MTITSERINQSVVVMCLSGRLDTSTAPQLERKLKHWGEETPEVVLDFMDLTYISSMGLRVLLQAQKIMTAQSRKLVIRNMNESIREVFEMTGFINLMVQEEHFVVSRKEEGGAVVFSLIGQMDSNNVPTLAEGLEALQAANREIEGAVTAILDLGQLSLVTSPAAKLLRETIAHSDWPQRKLFIRNVPEKVREIFTAEGLDNWLEPGENAPEHSKPGNP
jgi:anti-sigma B factor antagonist